MGVILSIGPIKGTEVDFWNAGNADYLVIVCKTLRQKKSQQNSHDDDDDCFYYCKK